MERRLNKKTDEYMSQFKTNIKSHISHLWNTQHDPNVNNLLQYIYDYDQLTFDKDDFTKRKRVKNMVPFFDRCCAKRANGEQCTRRKKEKDEYCGTHMKGTPHGIVTEHDENKVTTHKIDIWAQDIMGIIYYIDNQQNVYQPEDIIVNKVNPRVIAKYVKTGNTYSIPELNI
jgi:hypothetical protein